MAEFPKIKKKNPFYFLKRVKVFFLIKYVNKYSNKIRGKKNDDLSWSFDTNIKRLKQSAFN